MTVLATGVAPNCHDEINTCVIGADLAWKDA